ncbi:MAG: hypothetical protein MUE75_14650 [Algoriphagus sp.]|jgi:hypothetical protein|nr:hypothetical protein [Algoriphagus sp.]
MSKFLYTSIFLASFLAWGCNTSNEKSEFNDWELEIVDSIQIPTLESLNLMDVNPEKDLILFSVSKENTPMVLANGKGQVLARLEIPKDAPTAFGGVCSGAIFKGDSIVIQGRQGLYFYDLEFNFLSNLKRTYPPKGLIFSGFDHLRLASTYEGNKFISFSGNPQTDFPPNKREYYQNFNGLDLITLASQEFKPIAPLHPESRYLKSGMAFNFISLTFSVSKNQLTYAHQSDSLLYDLDLMDPSLKQTATKIPFDKFVLRNGFPYGSQEDYDGPTDYEGQISNLFKVEGHDLILYYSGIKKENLPPTSIGREEYRKETNRMNPQKWIVRSGKDSFSQPKILPKKYQIERVDSQNRIWAKQNVSQLAEEPEVVTYYQLKLTEK